MTRSLCIYYYITYDNKIKKINFRFQIRLHLPDSGENAGEKNPKN